LHTTSNALLFLIFAAMATLDHRVDESGGGRRRKRRRKHRHSIGQDDTETAAVTPVFVESPAR